MSHYIITAQVQRHAIKITVSVKCEYICANSINCVITFLYLRFSSVVVHNRVHDFHRPTTGVVTMSFTTES